MRDPQLKPTDTPLPAAAAGGPRIRVAFNRDCIGELERTLRMARDTVDVCVFAIADDRLKAALFQARRRGVRIRLMTEGDTATNDGADALELQAAGIDVRFETTPALMHHKFLVVDDHVTVTGSLNWTRKAAEFNHENLVVIDDATVAAAFHDEFERLWTDRGTSRRLPPRRHRPQDEARLELKPPGRGER